MLNGFKARGLINENIGKRLRALAGIRNDAAHGQFANFTKEDASGTVSGVSDFLAS
jgi:hypothetical protein